MKTIEELNVEKSKTSSELLKLQVRAAVASLAEAPC